MHDGHGDESQHDDARDQCVVEPARLRRRQPGAYTLGRGVDRGPRDEDPHREIDGRTQSPEEREHDETHAHEVGVNVESLSNATGDPADNVLARASMQTGLSWERTRVRARA